MTWTLGELAELLGAARVNADAHVIVSHFALDSREVRPGSLFCAIQGASVDGHEFAPAALAQGAVAVLAEKEVPGPHLRVPNLVSALAEAAGTVRQRFPGPVVGITGSNGKTAAKEFAAAALSPAGPVTKSPGNRNTEYSSPLVWLENDLENSSAVVVELAMRGPNQIAHLASFSRPHVAVITMIGTAHIEMVGSREGIAAAKSEILGPYSGFGEPTGPQTAIFWQEDEFLSTLRSNTSPETAVRTFGFSFDAECQVLGYRAISWDRCAFRARLDGVSFEAELATVGRHQALNAAAAVLAAHSQGVPVLHAAEALAQAELPPMRMEHRLHHGASLLLDTYNASPDSTVAALRTLAELPCDGRRFAVIGEMRELGDFRESGHRQVGKALATSPLEAVLLIGEATEWTRSEAVRAGYPEDRIERVESLDEVREFLDQLEPGDVALLKASRALGLERALENSVS